MAPSSEPFALTWKSSKKKKAPNLERFWGIRTFLSQSKTQKDRELIAVTQMTYERQKKSHFQGVLLRSRSESHKGNILEDLKFDIFLQDPSKFRTSSLFHGPIIKTFCTNLEIFKKEKSAKFGEVLGNSDFSVTG